MPVIVKYKRVRRRPPKKPILPFVVLGVLLSAALAAVFVSTADPANLPLTVGVAATKARKVLGATVGSIGYHLQQLTAATGHTYRRGGPLVEGGREEDQRVERGEQHYAGGPLVAPVGGDQILSMAYQDRHFDAERWLRSDRSFLLRRPGTISDHDRTIKKMARRYGFDWRLIAAQIFVESNFDARARSHAGALGLMQLLPSTAEEMGYAQSMLFLPEVNIAAGCLYDQRMYSRWGKQSEDRNRLAFALASYNAGRGRVLESYRKAEPAKTWSTVYPTLPAETQAYVHRIYLKHDFYKRHVLP